MLLRSSVAMSFISALAADSAGNKYRCVCVCVCVFGFRPPLPLPLCSSAISNMYFGSCLLSACLPVNWNERLSREAADLLEPDLKFLEKTRQKKQNKN